MSSFAILLTFLLDIAASFHQNNGVTEADENYHAQLLNHPQSIVRYKILNLLLYVSDTKVWFL